MRTLAGPVLALFSVTSTTGCLMARSGTDSRSAADEKAPAPAEAALAMQTSAEAAAPPAPGRQAQAQAGPSLAAMFAARKLIRTGQMTLEVRAYETAAEQVAALAESHGGYVADSKATRGAQDRQHGVFTIRVPAERFAAAFAALRGLGRVRTENISTDDVTKAYGDLETRLRVKRDTAERLREVLRGRTAKLADILEAERELARVTEEIERMEGERRFYDQQVALSTITVSLQEPQAVVEPGVFSPIGEAFRDSLAVLAASVAALVYAVVFLAPWSLVALAAWKSYRLVRRRRTA